MPIFEFPEGPFSLLVCTPKPVFFGWIEALVAPRGMTVDEVYDPVMERVWIIPWIGSFVEDDGLATYLEKLKPLLVREQMGGYGLGVDDMPDSFTAAMFDHYFSYEIRDSADLAPPV